jgi:maltodextrin utilization protein YvdJ
LNRYLHKIQILQEKSTSHSVKQVYACPFLAKKTPLSICKYLNLIFCLMLIFYAFVLSGLSFFFSDK